MSCERNRLQRFLRLCALWLLPPLLVVIAVAILVAQVTELATQKEVLSLSSFVVLLSFSGLAFNWCRVSAALTPEEIPQAVYQVAIDLFLASLLALAASFFAWLQTMPGALLAALYPGLFGLHLVFLCVALVYFLVSILGLLRVVRGIDRAE
jgi:hypothetical protein